MRTFAMAFVCLVFAVGAQAGDSPDVNVFLEFDNGQNYIDPAPWTLFTATVYLENFGSGGGVTATEFMLVRSFSGMTVSATSLLDGVEIGDPDTGWQITGSCELPDGTGRVAVAEVTYLYDGVTPGTLEVADHPSAARGVLDCSSGVDSWCVRPSPSGHAGVGVAAPPGDCPDANPCIYVTKEVDCDISKAGDEVIYHICVTNCGDTELFNITVVDDVMGDLSSFFSNSLMVDETECHDLPYTIQPGDPDPLINVVTVTGEDTYGALVVDTELAQVDLIHPSFDVTKVCLTPLVPPGGEAEFEITISNTGDCNLDFSTNAPGIGPFTLLPGDTFVTVETVPDPGGVGEICNEIDVTATIPPEYCDLPNVLMADAYDCCECASSACIEVTKEVDCDISKVGDWVIYEICITNCTYPPEPLYNVTVVDDMMGELTIPNPYGDPPFPTELAIGEMICRSFEYEIQPGDPDPLFNVVTVTGEDAYGNPVADTDVAQVDLIHPGFDVTKVCLTPLVPPGGDAQFEITITNTGDCDLIVTTDEPEIPGPIRIPAGSSHTDDTVFRPDPGGVPEICNEINVTATIPPEYCNLPNELVAAADDCCVCLPDFYLHPTMINVLDVGNDQGRNVRLRWLRSLNDAPGVLLPIASYEVYRRQDAHLAKDDIQPDSESTADGVRGGSRIDGWDYVATIPAHGDSVYQAIAPTLCDSTADGGICWSAFLIRGTTSNPYVYFDSPPDSGYSVDNLAPAPPVGLLADGDELLVTLTWDASEEEDFDYYAVYRDVVEDFKPGEPIGLTSEPTYEDTDPPAASAWWYRVAAFDFSGNESEASGSAGVVATGLVDAIPSRFWLGPAVPNPFNPVTDIQYWVPSGQKPCHVTLIIHDSTGRVVRHLVDGEIPPGVHVAPWDGRDDGGSLVASGVYFYSMEAGDYANRRRMVLLK